MLGSSCLPSYSKQLASSRPVQLAAAQLLQAVLPILRQPLQLLLLIMLPALLPSTRVGSCTAKLKMQYEVVVKRAAGRITLAGQQAAIY